MKAQFEVLKHEAEEYVFILDTGHTAGCRTVTNDAEYVIEQLFSEYKITENTRVFYKDSEGQIDELLYSERKFKAFKAGHEGVELCRWK